MNCMDNKSPNCCLLFLKIHDRNNHLIIKDFFQNQINEKLNYSKEDIILGHVKNKEIIDSLVKE